MISSLKLTRLAIACAAALSVAACGSTTASNPTAFPTGASPLVSPTASANKVTSCDDVKNALVLSWGQSQGAAGTEYRMIQMKNVSTQPCEIKTPPKVSLVNDTVVTLPAVAAPLSNQTPITVAADATLDISIGTANPDNFPSKDCHVAKATKAVITELTGPTDRWTYSLDVPAAESPWKFCTTEGNTPFFARFETEIN